jgi:hypothetical protein
MILVSRTVCELFHKREANDAGSPSWSAGQNRFRVVVVWFLADPAKRAPGPMGLLPWSTPWVLYV